MADDTNSKNAGDWNFATKGGGWVVLQFALLLAVLVLGLAYRGQWHHAVAKLLGLTLLAASAFLGIAGALALGRNLTPFPRPSSDSSLVQNGVYAWIRHPLYTAVICGSFSWSLLLASWPALFVSLSLIPVLDAKARREERWLREKFPEYSEYERRARRFIPWIY